MEIIARLILEASFVSPESYTVPYRLLNPCQSHFISYGFYFAVPPPPSNAKIENIAAEKVKISWKAAYGEVDGYQVTLFATGEQPLIKDVSNTTTTVEFTIIAGTYAFAEVKSSNKPAGDVGGGYSDGAYTKQIQMGMFIC